MKGSFLEKELNFGFENSDIMIKLKDLVLKKSYHKTVLNIKSALDDKFIILGEPIFKKYFFVLDYKNNRIGISHQRTNFVDQIVNVVTLIRFVVWIIVICKYQQYFSFLVDLLCNSNTKVFWHENS